MLNLCTNNNHSNNHNEQITYQNIDHSECLVIHLLKSIQKLLHNNVLKKYGFG
jgi:hypothetical protein